MVGQNVVKMPWCTTGIEMQNVYLLFPARDYICLLFW